jgi:hypothetical protein
VRALIIATAALIAACAPTWRRVDRATLVASTLSLPCDWGQTRGAAGAGWERSHERNPIMGGRPSTLTVDAYFAGAVAVNALAWAVLPARWRSLIPGVVIGSQAYAVALNADTARGARGL